MEGIRETPMFYKTYSSTRRKGYKISMKTFMGEIRKTLSERFGYESHNIGEVGARMPMAFKIESEQDYQLWFSQIAAKNLLCFCLFFFLIKTY